MATYRDIRVQLVDQTGRFDLVKTVGADDYVDNGANWYIDNAQRHLDRLMDGHGVGRDMEARYVASLTNGDYKLKFKHARVIRDVYLTRISDGLRVDLERKEHHELRDLVGEDFAQVDTGCPCYYAIASQRLNHEQRADDLSATKDDDDLEAVGDSTLYNGIIVMPPADESYTVTVFGDFHNVFEDDASVTWWSVQHPDILVQAAVTQMEGAMRNKTGHADAKALLNDLLIPVIKDSIEQEVEDIDQFEG